MSEEKTMCVDNAQGPINVAEEKIILEKKEKERVKMIAQVGKKAPDFEENAFVDGGFKKVKLSDFLGRWVILCFYPGDFTFV